VKTYSEADASFPSKERQLPPLIIPLF